MSKHPVYPIIGNLKQCIRCNETKPASEFYTNGKEHAPRPTCKSCEAELRRMWKKAEYSDALGYTRTPVFLQRFGVSLECYNGMLDKQNGVCAICGKAPTPEIALAIDHNHVTGRVRGLLCSSCNSALGSFQENIQRLHNAIDYLRRHGPVASRKQAPSITE